MKEKDKRIHYEGYMGLEDLFSFRKMMGEMYFDIIDEKTCDEIIEKIDRLIDEKFKQMKGGNNE